MKGFVQRRPYQLHRMKSHLEPAAFSHHAVRLPAGRRPFPGPASGSLGFLDDSSGLSGPSLESRCLFLRGGRPREIYMRVQGERQQNLRLCYSCQKHPVDLKPCVRWALFRLRLLLSSLSSLSFNFSTSFSLVLCFKLSVFTCSCSQMDTHPPSSAPWLPNVSPRLTHTHTHTYNFVMRDSKEHLIWEHRS